MPTRQLFDRFIIFLAELWKVDDFEKFSHLINHNDCALMLVSHGATKEKLSKGAEQIVHKAYYLYNYFTDFDDLGIYFGIFDKEPNWKIEFEEKNELFHKINFIGKVINTINECLAFKNSYYSKNNIDPRRIVIITDEAHSRRCRIVWKTFFPDSEIYIITVPIDDCVDTESPMTTYHKLWKILWNQAWPTPIFWFCSLFGEKGLMMLNKYHQPVTKN